jgi:multiple sugar transport system permease protein
MVSASLMPSGVSANYPPPLWPRTPTLEHYRELIAHAGFVRHFLNSLGIATGATLLALTLNVMAGYAFAKLEFEGRERLHRVLVAGLVIPAQVAMLPLFLELKALGLVDTLAGVLVPSLAGIFSIFLVRQAALSIPDELLDAARIDGASEWMIYRRIVLPLLRPMLVTLAVFTFLGAWNDFLWPLIILNDDDRYTLPVALASLSREHVQDSELMMAGAVVTVVPVLALFLGLQRYYLQGLMAGAVKG